MRLSCWTGTDNTLAAAVADHAYVAETPQFYQFIGYSYPPPVPATLTAMPALVLRQSLPGDANLDGTVDINDLTIVLAHYNQTGMTWTTGDFTGDGTVDINDLTIVLAHFNDSAGSSAAGSVSAAPSPARSCSWPPPLLRCWPMHGGGGSEPAAIDRCRDRGRPARPARALASTHRRKATQASPRQSVPNIVAARIVRRALRPSPSSLPNAKPFGRRACGYPRKRVESRFS